MLVQGAQVAGAVVVRGEGFGGHHLITMRDAQEPFVKGLVTELAERQPVAQVLDQWMIWVASTAVWPSTVRMRHERF